MSHASLHVDAVIPANPLVCHHPEGRLSIQVSDSPVLTWLSGTPDELRSFAVGLAEKVDEIVSVDGLASADVSGGPSTDRTPTEAAS